MLFYIAEESETQENCREVSLFVRNGVSHCIYSRHSYDCVYGLIVCVNWIRGTFSVLITILGNERREIYKSWYVHIKLNNGLCVIFPLLIDLTSILGEIVCECGWYMYVVFLSECVCVCVYNNVII